MKNETEFAVHPLSTTRRVSRANRNRRLQGRSWVYFAQLGENGPIKIGQSRQVPSRLQALQTAHHEAVRLLGTIPETDIPEPVLHDRFARHRIKGEWFKPAQEILDLAAAGDAIYRNGYVNIVPDDLADELAIIFSVRSVFPLPAREDH